MEKEPKKYAELLASDVPVDGPIEEDIPRTMFDHEMFCKDSRVDGKDMLRRVLTAYGRYDREVRLHHPGTVASLIPFAAGKPAHSFAVIIFFSPKAGRLFVLL